MANKQKFEDTWASLPGRTKVDLRVWIRCFPQETVPRLIRLALVLAIPTVFLIAAPGSAWGIVVFSLILILAQAYPLWRDMTHIQAQFAQGCLNPAVVVCTQPYLIAVYGDLSLREGDSWPVIKILPQPLEKVRGRRMQEGDKMATASFYYGDYFKPHWSDFTPVAVPCVTDDDQAIRDAVWRLKQREEEDVWGDLEKYLARVPKPYQPGLYWMRTQ